MLEKQQKESQKIAQRISSRKDDLEKKNIRRNELLLEIEQT